MFINVKNNNAIIFFKNKQKKIKQYIYKNSNQIKYKKKKTLLKDCTKKHLPI
jgi:hypothetical protein